MFFQQLHNFDFRVGRDARLARVNVQLEQRTNSIYVVPANGDVQRSLASVVDRVLLDAVQRTQHLTRARVAIKSCDMQRRRTVFCEKKKRFRS